MHKITTEFGYLGYLGYLDIDVFNYFGKSGIELISCYINTKWIGIGCYTLVPLMYWHMNCNSKMKVDTKHIPKAVILAYDKNSWADKSINQTEVNIRIQQRRIDENVTKDAGFFAFSK